MQQDDVTLFFKINMYHENTGASPRYSQKSFKKTRPTKYKPGLLRVLAENQLYCTLNYAPIG